MLTTVRLSLLALALAMVTHHNPGQGVQTALRLLNKEQTT